MTNAEKYKAAEERYSAFRGFDCACAECKSSTECSGDISECALRWLELEAVDEKLLPCPFCGSECELHEIWDNEECKSAGHNVRCKMCEYKSPWACKYDGSDAIAAHNRVAKAVMEAKKEASNEKL